MQNLRQASPAKRDEIWDELSGSSGDEDVGTDDNTFDPFESRSGGNMKATQMKKIKTFDDVLHDQSEGESSFPKLVAFCEVVYQISALKREGSTDEEMQRERFLARRLCREIEVELNCLPLALQDAELHRRLKHKFAKVKRSFEALDNALQREKTGRRQEPSASVFGELKVVDDYDYEPNQTDRRDKKKTTTTKMNMKTTTKRTADVRLYDAEDGQVGKKQESSRDFQKQTQKVADADESLETLKTELEQVLGLFQDFNELVHAQQPMVDQFEQNVLVAEEETKSAVRELATGASYGSYALPLMGAAVGALFFGPLGAIAGAKGAAAMGVCVASGMGVGAYLGRKVSAKQSQEAALILARCRQDYEDGHQNTKGHDHNEEEEY